MTVAQLIDQYRLLVEEGRAVVTPEDRKNWSDARQKVRETLKELGLPALAECLTWEGLLTKVVERRDSRPVQDRTRSRKRLEGLLEFLGFQIKSYLILTPDAPATLWTFLDGLVGRAVIIHRARHAAQNATDTVLDQTMWNVLAPWVSDPVLFAQRDEVSVLAVARLITQGILDWSGVALHRSDTMRDPEGFDPVVIAGQSVVLTALGRRLAERHRERITELRGVS